jgi:hypothetical protein
MTTKFKINFHDFSHKINEILELYYGEYARDVFEASSILGYQPS